MTINGKETLLLEKRGMNYYDTTAADQKSDIGNFRVFVEFEDRHGVDVCGDFGGYAIRDYEKKSRPIIKNNALHADLQYENKRGCWGYNAEKRHGKKADPARYEYTKEGILNFVNACCGRKKYNSITFVERFEMYVDKDRNYTPRDLIKEYSTAHNLETVSGCFGEIFVKLYTGTYKYFALEKGSFTTDGKRKITVILESVTA